LQEFNKTVVVDVLKQLQVERPTRLVPGCKLRFTQVWIFQIRGTRLSIPDNQ